MGEIAKTAIRELHDVLEQDQADENRFIGKRDLMAVLPQTRAKWIVAARFDNDMRRAYVIRKLQPQC